MSRVQKHGRVEVVVNADVQDVWRVVSEVTRIGEWSHECRSAEWSVGFSVPTVGALFRGHNRVGWLRWSRTAEFVDVAEPRELAWRTVPTWRFPDSTEWRISLAARGTGTVITQSFTVLRAPWLLDHLYARLIPTHQDRNARLADDLVRLGAVARHGGWT